MGAVEVISAGSAEPHWSPQAGEAFVIRLTVNVHGAERERAAPFEYRLTVTARAMGVGSATIGTIGERAGVLPPAGIVHLDLSSSGLPAGIYRLDGVLRVFKPGATRALVLLSVNGGLLDVSEA
jgi:hypothetical protein